MKFTKNEFGWVINFLKTKKTLFNFFYTSRCKQPEAGWWIILGNWSFRPSIFIETAEPFKKPLDPWFLRGPEGYFDYDIGFAFFCFGADIHVSNMP